MIGPTEAQSIRDGYRARTHRKYIPTDPSHASGSTLVGLDERRMVVRFHFENNSLAITNIDDTGIFSGSLDDPRPGGR